MRNLTKEEILQIPKLIETMTIREISNHFGVHERSISKQIKRLRDSGIKVPTKMGRPPIQLP